MHATDWVDFQKRVALHLSLMCRRVSSAFAGLDDTSIENGVPQVWCIAHGLGQNHRLCLCAQRPRLSDVAGLRWKFRDGPTS